MCVQNTQSIPSEQRVVELQQLMDRINQLLGSIAQEKLALATQIVALKRSKAAVKRSALWIQDLIQCKIHGGYANAGFSFDEEDCKDVVQVDIEDEEEEGPVVLIGYKKHAFDA